MDYRSIHALEGASTSTPPLPVHVERDDGRTPLPPEGLFSLQSAFDRCWADVGIRDRERPSREGQQEAARPIPHARSRAAVAVRECTLPRLFKETNDFRISSSTLWHMLVLAEMGRAAEAPRGRLHLQICSRAARSACASEGSEQIRARGGGVSLFMLRVRDSCARVPSENAADSSSLDALISASAPRVSVLTHAREREHEHRHASAAVTSHLQLSGR